jgi:hypothetical protein
MKANRHRFPGAGRRHRKPVVEPSQEVEEMLNRAPGTDSRTDLHRELRVALADGPLTFGQLRISYEISPMTLLQDCIGKHPETYTEGVDAEGHPMIGLQPGAPPLDVMLEREPLLELIRQAGLNGIYLLSLHVHTGLTSHRIEKLLSGVVGIEQITRDKRVMFRMEPGQVPESQQSQEPSEAEPEVARDRLIALIGGATCRRGWNLEVVRVGHRRSREQLAGRYRVIVVPVAQ